VVAVLMALLCGLGLATLKLSGVRPHAPKGASLSAENWSCPMHSFVRERHSGHCPICGMALVLLHPSESHAISTNGGSVDDSQLIRHLGLRLASVTKTTLTRDIRTYGIVTVAEDGLLNVSPKTEGWVKRLLVSSIGQRVRRDQPLYEFYSSELIAKQREYIELLDRKDQLSESVSEISNQTAQVLASLARERIRARDRFLQADVSESVLRFIEATHRTVDVVTILAPQDGIVTQIGAREGSYVTPMVNVLSLAGANSVWLDVSLYPDQLAWIHEGDWATVAYQDRTVRSRISLRSTVSDPSARALHERIVLPADPGSLYSGQVVDVLIHTQAHPALVVPTSAIVHRGSSDFVMRWEAGKSFRMVPVKAGVEDSELTEIVSGLEEANRVAVNGQFLLDADAPLSASGENRSPNE
jgi:membrane fusion protein, copper/silver efflux system